MDFDQAEDPEQMLLRMAAGDCSALLYFTRILMQSDESIPPREALVAAECFASLAASTGSPAARSALASVLVCRSSELRADDPERSENIWWMAASMMFDLATENGDEAAASALLQGLSARADAGDEEAAVLLNETIAALPPATLKAAQSFQLQTKTEAQVPVGRGGRSGPGMNNLGAGKPASIAEVLALASLASGSGANSPLPANPAAGGQNSQTSLPPPPGFTLAN